MFNKKEYTKILDKFGKERIRIKLEIEKGKVIDFVFQYESYIQDKWREIVRYDVAHGFFHRDFINPNSNNEKIKIGISDMKTALTYAEQDIKDKWEFYKTKYLKELNKYHNDK